METDCPFIYSNNNVEGSLIRLQVNIPSVRREDGKKKRSKREGKYSVQKIKQGVKEERREESREIKEKEGVKIYTVKNNMNKEYQSVPVLFYSQIPRTRQKFQSLKCSYLGTFQNLGSIYKIYIPRPKSQLLQCLAQYARSGI